MSGMVARKSKSNLGKLREQAGFDQITIAQRYGVEPSYLSRIESGNVGLTTEWARRFANDYRVNVEDILNCFSEPEKSAYKNPPSFMAFPRKAEEGSDDFILIPVYDVQASAGAGAWLKDDACIIDRLAFRLEWLQKKTGAPPENLVIIKVHGDSMEPTLKSGDVVLINRTQVSPVGGGIFVIEQDGALLVKRLGALPGGKVLVMSDNGRYDAYELAEGSGVVVGRAIYRMGDL